MSDARELGLPEEIRVVDEDSLGPVKAISIPARELKPGDVVRFKEGWLPIYGIQNISDGLLLWGGDFDLDGDPNKVAFRIPDAPCRAISWSEVVDVAVADEPPQISAQG